MRGIMLVGLLAIASCGGSKDDAPLRAEDASAAVEAWFAAIAAKDCDRVRAMTLPALDAAACDGMLHDFEQRDTRLGSIDSTTPDARAPGTFVVQATVFFRHKATNKHRWILRAEREGGQWKVHAP